MKKIFLVFMLSAAVFSCKNSEEKNKENETTTVSENLKTFQGEFIYTADAAVLKGNSFIYGVKLNEKAQELAQKVASVKKEDYDMVPVVVRGELTAKEEGTEGWDEILTIEEIVRVSDKPSAPDVKLEEAAKKN